MRAVILAAGRGSRMGHLGDDRPKCLVELEGKPLDRAPDRGAAARRGGRDRGRPRLSRRDDRFSRPLLFRQRTMGRNQYGDVARRGRSLAAFGAGHRQLCRHLLPQRVGARSGRRSGPVVISYDRAWRRLWTRRFADPLADAETFRIDAAGQLLEIGGKTTRIEDIEGQYMGLLKFTPPAWSAVEALLGTLDAPIRDRLDVTGLLRRLLAGKELPDRHFRHRWPMGRNRQSGRRGAVPEHGRGGDLCSRIYVLFKPDVNNETRRFYGVGRRLRQVPAGLCAAGRDRDPELCGTRCGQHRCRRHRRRHWHLDTHAGGPRPAFRRRRGTQ
jgi:L-glutamine-phosphate cytidylyltransferase